MKVPFFLVLMATNAAPTIVAATAGLRGRPNRHRLEAEGAVATVPDPATHWTLVFDLHTLSPTGFSCSLQGYSIGPQGDWEGLRCSLGCGGSCGFVQFVAEPSQTDALVNEYFTKNVPPGSFFITTKQSQYHVPNDDAVESPLEMAAIVDLSISHSNGTTTELNGLHLGFGATDSTGALTWYVGSPSCRRSKGRYDDLVCGSVGLVNHCNNYYYADDSLPAMEDACIEVTPL